jgi:hypothetical protein
MLLNAERFEEHGPLFASLCRLLDEIISHEAIVVLDIEVFPIDVWDATLKIFRWGDICAWTAHLPRRRYAGREHAEVASYSS